MRVHVKLNDVASVQRVKQELLENHIMCPVMVSFAAQATHHPILIVPDTSIRYVGFEESYTGYKPGEYFYIGIVEFGHGLYPFPRQGNLDWGYVYEKLHMNNEADCINITVFLNALRHPRGVEYYLSHVPLDGDHVNWDVFKEQGGHCLYVR